MSIYFTPTRSICSKLNTNKMKKHDGIPESPIWLIGDSNPQNWVDHLDTPLDPRHPIRHNIWTPILDHIQNEAFKEGKRIDSSKIFIRNAVEYPANRDNCKKVPWKDRHVTSKLSYLKHLINENNPEIILSFGRFSFEFTRRALNEKPHRRFDSMNTTLLGQEFDERINTFMEKDPNLIPLLHRSIAGRYFPQSHKRFVGNDKGNYFEHTGKKLGKYIIKYMGNKDIWIK